MKNELTQWQKIPLILIMGLIDAMIVITVATSTMMCAVESGLGKTLALVTSISVAAGLMFYIRFNHKLRNKLIKE